MVLLSVIEDPNLLNYLINWQNKNLGIFAIISFSLCSSFMKLINTILISFINIALLFSFSLKSTGQENNLHIQLLTKQIIKEPTFEKKLILNEQLLESIKSILASDKNNIQAIDSTGLIYDLISEDKQVQVLSWAILFSKKWEYFGFIKSYNKGKKYYEIWELTPTDFILSSENKKPQFNDNWPAGVYYKIIETSYNKRKYYTLVGWLAQNSQTAYKFLDVLTLSKSGKPSFGKTSFIRIDKKYANRILFGYNSQSSFQLNYGEYDYSEKKWNSKKKKYEQKVFTENLIVFDHLIPMYPDLKDHPEFLVPSGNIVDAFVFKKGKWRMKYDIDARNLKLKIKKNSNPTLNLFPNK